MDGAKSSGDGRQLVEQFRGVIPDHFTPELFKRALKYLYLHGRHIEQYLSKYYSPNTHLTGEALGLYYLGTQLPFFKRSERWRKLGEDILFDEVIKQIHPDGVYFEQSTWYQRYTADIYSQFSILRSLDPEAGFDLRGQEVEERIELAFDHMMHMTMPDGTTPLIGDDDGGRMLPLTHTTPDDFVERSGSVQCSLTGRIKSRSRGEQVKKYFG